MSIDFNENAIEFLENQKFMFVTFSQKKYINKVKALAEKYPDKVKIYEERTDSIYAKMPTSWLKIQPSRVLSEKQKEDGLREMLRGLSQTYEERAEFRRRMLLPMRSMREANRGRVNALDLARRMEQSRDILPRRWADKTRGDMR